MRHISMKPTSIISNAWRYQSLFNDTANRISPTSEILWRHAKPTAKMASETCFIKKIRSGKLCPRVYEKFIIQDIHYCWQLHENLQILLNNPKNTDHKHFLENTAKVSHQYMENMLKQHSISNPSEIEVNPNIQTYIDYQKKVILEGDITLSLVSMLPCEMLWAWLANKIKDEMESGNAYLPWIKEHATESPGIIAKYLNGNILEIDLERAKIIFKNCMLGEYNFFASQFSEPTQKITPHEITPNNHKAPTPLP